MDVLGVSGFYHDAAAALVRDGVVIAAAQEERFTRRKHDPSLPVHAIEYCLREGDVPERGLDAVVFYEKPLISFVRVLRTYASIGPAGFRSVHRAIPEWARRKLWVPYEIHRALQRMGFNTPEPILLAEHHISHAAAAFYPSPFASAAVLTFDGVGEWATSSIGRGAGASVELLRELRFPDSLGLLYSAFTYQAGFRVNSGEYKLMGLAPYGEPRYRDRILDELIDLAEDGSFRTDLSYFDYLAGIRMTNRRFDLLFDGSPRAPEAPITRRECDLARSVQEVVEEVVLRMARHAHELTGERRAVLGGGVALNCVANGRLLREGPFDELWVQPAAGDAGSAVGCALWAWHEVMGNPRTVVAGQDGMAGCYLGPSFDPDQIASELVAAGRPFERITDAGERAERIAELVDEGAVVGLFQGRMEFGPRALGHRSIIADPRDPAMQRQLNLRIKNRESFRPFAPAVLAEHASDWFELDAESPYMLLVTPVHPDRLSQPVPATGPDEDSLDHEPRPEDRIDVIARLAAQRSEIPAVTHIDGSARVQTVDAVRSPAFHRILTAFHERTGCPVLVNTSFNVRGEPIVCTPEEAYRCLMTTDIDVLVLEDCVLRREEQPEWSGTEAPIELD